MLKRFRDHLSFLKQYIKNPKQVGAVFPSTRFLVQKMLETVDFEHARIIVELGSGEGKFTREILKRMRPDARLYVIEINQKFISKLMKINDDRLVLISESAEKLKEILSRLQIRSADCFISGLPLLSFRKEIKDRMIDQIAGHLKDGHPFVQFSYLPLHFNLFKKYFNYVEIKGFVLLNIPPAFVFVCKHAK